MTKHEFIDALAKKSGITKKMAASFLADFVDIITDELKKGKQVTVTGFGTFKVTQRKARKGVNPQNTSESITIPAMKLPSFRAGKTLKDAFKK